MEIGDKVKFADIPIGDYFTDSIHIFKSVKSGEVTASFAPEFPVMQVYELMPDLEKNLKKASFSKGDITEDFFRHDFIYLGTKEKTDEFIKRVKEGYKNK
ncbi:Uncharacterised protein [uncultured archaeon]|nr:Uncharacterised protein [uncultured archaeon]